MPGVDDTSPTLHIHTFVGEKKDDYELFKNKYIILKVKVNGKDKKIDEQRTGFPLNMGDFKTSEKVNEVEIYIRNQQTKDIIKIEVPIIIVTVC